MKIEDNLANLNRLVEGNIKAIEGLFLKIDRKIDDTDKNERRDSKIKKKRSQKVIVEGEDLTDHNKVIDEKIETIDSKLSFVNTEEKRKDTLGKTKKIKEFVYGEGLTMEKFREELDKYNIGLAYVHKKIEKLEKRRMFANLIATRPITIGMEYNSLRINTTEEVVENAKIKQRMEEKERDSTDDNKVEQKVEEYSKINFKRHELKTLTTSSFVLGRERDKKAKDFLDNLAGIIRKDETKKAFEMTKSNHIVTSEGREYEDKVVKTVESKENKYDVNDGVMLNYLQEQLIELKKKQSKDYDYLLNILKKEKASINEEKLELKENMSEANSNNIFEGDFTEQSNDEEILKESKVIVRNGSHKSLLSVKKDQSNRSLAQLKTKESNEALFKNTILEINNKLNNFRENIIGKADASDFDIMKSYFFSQIEKVQLSLDVSKAEMAQKFAEFKATFGRKADKVTFSLKEYKNEILDVTKPVVEKIIRENFNTLLETDENYSRLAIVTAQNDASIKELFESLVELRRENLEGSARDALFRTLNDRLKLMEFDIERMKAESSVGNNKAVLSENSQEASEDEIKSFKKELENFEEELFGLKKFNKVIKERIDSLQFSLSNIQGDILKSMKKELHSQSQTLMEDFKKDLKKSMGKIEKVLKEKVDKFNLDEVARQLDKKLLQMVAQKMDKEDLMRNNNMFNKKIDSLENKISKTLVDTIIDIQNEEAPLIVKVNADGEKCGSCNQVVKSGNAEERVKQFFDVGNKSTRHKRVQSVDGSLPDIYKR